MSTMIFLELPHINVLSKVDLIKDTVGKRELKKFFNPDPRLLEEYNDEDKGDYVTGNEKFRRLNKAIAQLVDDFGMVQFLPLDCSDKDSNKSVELILSHIDDITQWNEAQEPKEPKDEFEIPEDDDDGEDYD